MSFAECSTDPELKLVQFEPSSLSIYLPKESIVKKELSRYHEDEDEVTYNILYKNKLITLSNFHNINMFFMEQDEEVNDIEIRFNISTDKAKILEKNCHDKSCSSQEAISGRVYQRRDYSASFMYPLPMINEHDIGKEFMNALFIDNYKCISVEPDSIVNHGPFQIDIKFDSNSAAVLPQYHDNIAAFAKFINENDVNVNIEGHRDITENRTGLDTAKNSLPLAEKRAEAIKNLLVKKYGVNLDKIKKIEGYGGSRALASNDTEEGRQINRRVQAYVYANIKPID